MIRQTLLGAAGALLLAGAASAQGMRAPVGPVMTWDGFYIGANMGYVQNNDRLSYINEFTGGAVIGCGVVEGCARNNSVIGGGQIGYNLQFGSFVLGAVADAAAMRVRNDATIVFGTNTAPGAPFGSVATDAAYIRARQTGLYTVRGRLGYTLFENVMVYATGGLAISEIDISTTEALAPGQLRVCINPTQCRTGKASKTLTGYTVGGGVEWALNQSWSVGAEYLYVDLGTARNVIPQSTLAVRFPLSTTGLSTQNHVARVSLNYKFNLF